jgi:sterol desaturase/sphingolipid hydroxylase (fatty acid hydroxylase superfamily)
MLTKDILFGVNILSLARFLLYGFIAMTAHFLMSLGQTVFHRYLGHRRLGGRFFKNHMQFHHAHYSGNHVVSTHYLDNGDNNTLFFLTPVALVVGLSYLFLRLDLFVVQMAAMSLSFYGHVYIDKQYHVAESWLCRFSWFRRKQQLHFVHHRHASCNFAVIDYFWDRLLGTYRSAEATRQTAGSSAATPTAAANIRIPCPLTNASGTQSPQRWTPAPVQNP